MTNRTIRIWTVIHKWTSLICTIFMLLLCLTGLPLIFHDEIEALTAEDTLPPMPADTPLKSLDEAVASALATYPGERPLFLSFDVDRPVVNVTTGPGARPPVSQMHISAIDLRTTRILADLNDDDGFMHVMLRLHVDLFAGLPGELFLGFMGFLLFLATLSGVVIYAPFMRKLSFGTVRAGRGRRLKWLDLHNMLGIVTLMWVVVVGLTGVINTLSVPLVAYWRANELAAMIAPYEGKPVPERFASVDAAVRTAMEAAPGMRPQFVAFPGVRFSSNHHYAVWLKGATPATNRILTPALIDAETGAFTDMRSMPWYMLALRLSQPLHFGDYGGLPMKILWAVLDLLTIVILGSGLYLWIARRRHAQGRAQNHAAAGSGLRAVAGEAAE
ncbi:PepSY domain-containing protein (plasmid) [Azospirillum argentinense]|uniref:PepSY domain-containing protein n=1 Tax=Azospirillum argentinense TaxID=2970906 RepID=A0A4D8PJD7_9PROT|nr:PepSY-associated TM helix domain-containing protein [Azospirillum argentinense]QCN98452.1 PepSY domain-containing protein [Azospirillum argentinense]